MGTAGEATIGPAGRVSGLAPYPAARIDALREFDLCFRKSGKAIIAAAVREILEEEIARKLAQFQRS